MPILPLAPGRFSTKNGAPSFWLRNGTSFRVMRSPLVAGGYGMINRTGLVGQDVCAAVVCAARTTAGTAVIINPTKSRRALCIAVLPAIRDMAGYHTSISRPGALANRKPGLDGAKPGSWRLDACDRPYRPT